MREKGDMYQNKVYTNGLVSVLNLPRVCFTFLSTLHEHISLMGRRISYDLCHRLIRVHYIISVAKPICPPIRTL
jgi:hypothetical protein